MLEIDSMLLNWKHGYMCTAGSNGTFQIESCIWQQTPQRIDKNDINIYVIYFRNMS